MTKANSSLGAIFTPQDIASVMTHWAIIDKSNKVLDLGIGNGAFVFEAHKALLELGAKDCEASNQIFGSEIDEANYLSFTEAAQKQNLIFPNIQLIDFFNYHHPDMGEVDAVIGNPPYVRRKNISSVDNIRRIVLSSTGIQKTDLKNLSDLYIYFILHAATKLKPGGRMCVVTADPWLNVGYGSVLKEYLNKHFNIDALLTLDRKMFPKVDVRGVILHATKKTSNNISNSVTNFIRVPNEVPIIKAPIYTPVTTDNSSVTVTPVSQEDLKPKLQWGIFFKIGNLYKEISQLPFMSPVSMVAHTQIGHQTLAKDFFIIPHNRTNNIEAQFLKPIVQAPKFYYRHPIITSDTSIDCYVFYCNSSKEHLAGTHALEYIEKAEEKEVTVRGKGYSVKGYQSKERIQRANRGHWYDIKTYLDRRPKCEILVPRFIYHEYLVLWNKAHYITGELFLDFQPKSSFGVKVYLAILNSTLAELMFRVHAIVYGGGTNNMSPGEYKKVPILNPNFISQDDRNLLIHAYDEFISNNQSRKFIDEVIYKILGIKENEINRVVDTLNDLLTLTTTK